MSLDTRLQKLMPALSAKERAILILRSLKEETEEDPSWRNTMAGQLMTIREGVRGGAF